MFWYIKLPLIRDVLIVAFIMAVNGLLKAFDIPYITTYGGPGGASDLVATYMYKTAFGSVNYGYGSAISVFLFVESMIAISLLRKLFTKSN
jgi:raffinose/stachyose/melibiose transport system permease protein